MEEQLLSPVTGSKPRALEGIRAGPGLRAGQQTDLQLA